MRRIAIVGGAGRMGQVMALGLGLLDDVFVAALVDTSQPRALFGARYAASLDELEAADLDVVVDFSTPVGAVRSGAWCAEHSVALVLGVTGLSDEQRRQIEAASERTSIVMASNFSLGAVLSERFAVIAAKHFERVEIIEFHHDSKVDAPSGTSLSTAHAIAEARARAGLGPLVEPTTRFSVAGARGADAGEGIAVHSVRLPGLVAHQEILFGSPGEGLTIRHDSYDRQSFVRGVELAIRSMSTAPGLVLGIDSFLD
ncbi:MAG TPA: 4-hydroxy-tetrahydrodipicolinate reductase [Acidimicrobiales bacterium]|nr:4-hydroxy-tetrahydrodipicolinate reductase [Acidimicrobiales bacterium]